MALRQLAQRDGSTAGCSPVAGASGGIVISPITVTGQRSRNPGSSAGADAALAGLAGDVDLDQHPRLGRCRGAELRERRVAGHRVDVAARSGSSCRTLRLCRCADEIPGELAGVGVRLGHQLLGAVLAQQLDARLASTPSSSTGTYLTAARISTSSPGAARGGDLGADPLEVRRATSTRTPTAQRSAQTTRCPAWRPVIPRSRRCEKNNLGSSRSCTARRRGRPRPRRARAAIARDRLQVEVASAPHGRRRSPAKVAREPPPPPRSSTARPRARSPPRPAALGAELADGPHPCGDHAGRQAAPAGVQRSPAAPPPATAIGRQSAVSTIGATPARRGRLAVGLIGQRLAGSGGSARRRGDLAAVHLADIASGTPTCSASELAIALAPRPDRPRSARPRFRLRVRSARDAAAPRREQRARTREVDRERARRRGRRAQVRSRRQQLDPGDRARAGAYSKCARPGATSVWR